MRNRQRITSVKPGRGPSFMGGVMALVAVVAGVIWMVTASAMAADSPFGGVGSFLPAFGLLFILVGLVSVVYSFRNAVARERYSVLDITDSETEPDPLNELLGNSSPQGDAGDDYARQDRRPGSREIGGVRYCPYCGKSVQEEFKFCPVCGKELTGLQ